MLRKFLSILIVYIIPLPLFAHTLVIKMKKYGETEMNVTHLYVQQAGLNSVGDYVIRFQNGQELSVGKPSDFVKFSVRYVDDYDTVAR